MSDMESQFSLLRQLADPEVAESLVRLIREGKDHELNRINTLDFSRQAGLDEEKTISGFLQSAKIGIFDLSWNVLCPGCSGVLDAHDTLKALRPDDYHCGLCGCGYQTSVDEQVEVAFTVASRVRHIAAHEPHSLPHWEYFRQIFWSSAIDINEESFLSLTEQVTLDAQELPAGERSVMSLELPRQFIIVFEPVTHSAQFVEVQGKSTDEVQHLSLVYGKSQPAGTMTLRPGPVRLTLDNRTSVRVLPTVLVASAALHALLNKRRPFLTAKRMLSNQTFRDVFKSDNLKRDQRLKITSMTFLFTDLKGSTALYDRIGDLAAFDLVSDHFNVLLQIVLAQKGAVVKTIGDAMMATFVHPEQALAAALKMRAAMKKLNSQRGSEDLVVKIGIHEGPCLAVMLNEQQDYFGQTVNIASRVQNLSKSQDIHITTAIIDTPGVGSILRKEAIKPIRKRAALRGIADEMVVYEIP